MGFDNDDERLFYLFDHVHPIDSLMNILGFIIEQNQHHPLFNRKLDFENK